LRLTLLTLIALYLLTPAAPVTYWLGGVDPVVLSDWHKSDPGDYMQLFDPHSPWEKSATKVTVFKISMQFASRSTEADLTTLITDLHRRGIGLAIEMGMLKNDRGCGKGEGYMPAKLPGLAMSRIKRLGGEVDYIAMDEVVFFGHERNWPKNGIPPCKDPLPDLVKDVAATITGIQQYFPQVKIGTIEPITGNHGFNPKQLVQDYLAFADLYHTATGNTLAFFHADIAWRSKDWQRAIAPLNAGLRARGIRFGVIIGGDPDYTDDLSWTRAGLHQLSVLNANPATAPDDIIIQSWQPLPTHFLPETTPGTTTWMLLEAEK
jgi:hypothetical protein